jgi:hypothetical protein
MYTTNFSCTPVQLSRLVGPCNGLLQPELHHLCELALYELCTFASFDSGADINRLLMWDGAVKCLFQFFLRDVDICLFNFILNRRAIRYDLHCQPQNHPTSLQKTTENVPFEIRTHNLSRRAAAILRLRAGAHIRVLNVRCCSGAGITVWDSTN